MMCVGWVALVLMSVCCTFAQLSGTKTIGGTSPDYSPGATFTIRGGTYNEDSLAMRTATAKASAPIVVKPATGATVTINVTPTTYTTKQEDLT